MGGQGGLAILLRQDDVGSWQGRCSMKTHEQNELACDCQQCWLAGLITGAVQRLLEALLSMQLALG